MPHSFIKTSKRLAGVFLLSLLVRRGVSSRARTSCSPIVLAARLREHRLRCSWLASRLSTHHSAGSPQVVRALHARRNQPRRGHLLFSAWNRNRQSIRIRAALGGLRKTFWHASHRRLYWQRNRGHPRSRVGRRPALLPRDTEAIRIARQKHRRPHVSRLRPRRPAPSRLCALRGYCRQQLPLQHLARAERIRLATCARPHRRRLRSTCALEHLPRVLPASDKKASPQTRASAREHPRSMKVQRRSSAGFLFLRSPAHTGS